MQFKNRITKVLIRKKQQPFEERQTIPKMSQSKAYTSQATDLYNLYQIHSSHQGEVGIETLKQRIKSIKAMRQGFLKTAILNPVESRQDLYFPKRTIADHHENSSAELDSPHSFVLKNLEEVVDRLGENDQIVFIESSEGSAEIDQPFIDKEFQPDRNAIDGNTMYFPETISMQRLTERMSEPALFKQRVEPQDIVQGRLLDCYFLASLAALAQKPERIQRLFLDGGEQQPGKYTVKIIYRGKWVAIDLDDYSPFEKVSEDSYLPAFSKSKDNETWVLLLEKAWAKLYGNYQNIESGFAEEALHDLTGAPCRNIFLKYRGFDPENSWHYLVEAAEKQYPIVVDSLPGSDIQLSAKGVVQGHAYTLLNATAVKFNPGSSSFGKNLEERLVQLRNPWGKVEYNGRWSDSDVTWAYVSEEEKKRLGYLPNRNDGIFFMSYGDFLKQFYNITIAQVNDNASYVYASYHDPQKQGAYFTIEILQPGAYSLQINKTPRRSIQQSSNQIYLEPEAELKGVRKVTNNSSGILYQGLLSRRRTLSRSYELEKGRYVASVRVNFTKHEKDFQIVLAVYSDNACLLRVATLEEAQLYEQNDQLTWADRVSISHQGLASHPNGNEEESEQVEYVENIKYEEDHQNQEKGKNVENVENVENKREQMEVQMPKNEVEKQDKEENIQNIQEEEETEILKEKFEASENIAENVVQAFHNVGEKSQDAKPSSSQQLETNLQSNPNHNQEGGGKEQENDVREKQNEDKDKGEDEDKDGEKGEKAEQLLASRNEVEMEEDKNNQPVITSDINLNNEAVQQSGKERENQGEENIIEEESHHEGNKVQQKLDDEVNEKEGQAKESDLRKYKSDTSVRDNYDPEEKLEGQEEFLNHQHLEGHKNSDPGASWINENHESSDAEVLIDKTRNSLGDIEQTQGKEDQEGEGQEQGEQKEEQKGEQKGEKDEVQRRSEEGQEGQPTIVVTQKVTTTTNRITRITNKTIDSDGKQHIETEVKEEKDEVVEYPESYMGSNVKEIEGSEELKERMEMIEDLEEEADGMNLQEKEEDKKNEELEVRSAEIDMEAHPYPKQKDIAKSDEEKNDRMSRRIELKWNSFKEEGDHEGEPETFQIELTGGTKEQLLEKMEAEINELPDYDQETKERLKKLISERLDQDEKQDHQNQ